MNSKLNLIGLLKPASNIQIEIKLFKIRILHYIYYLYEFVTVDIVNN